MAKKSETNSSLSPLDRLHNLTEALTEEMGILEEDTPARNQPDFELIKEANLTRRCLVNQFVKVTNYQPPYKPPPPPIDKSRHIPAWANDPRQENSPRQENTSTKSGLPDWILPRSLREQDK